MIFPPETLQLVAQALAMLLSSGLLLQTRCNAGAAFIIKRFKEKDDDDHKPRIRRTQPVVKYKGSITFEPSTVNAASIKDFSMDVSFCLAEYLYGAFCFEQNIEKEGNLVAKVCVEAVKVHQEVVITRWRNF